MDINTTKEDYTFKPSTTVINYLYNSKQISDAEYKKYLLSPEYYYPKLITPEEGELELCYNNPQSYQITPTGLRCNCCSKLVIS